MLTIEKYTELFSAEFNPDGLPISPTTGLFDEMGLDSFDAFRMLLFLESLADVQYPPDEVPPIFTVGDSYGYYRALLAHAQAERVR